MNAVKIVMLSSLNMAAFLPAVRESTGIKASKKPDAKGLQPPALDVACLEAIGCGSDMFHVGILIAADEDTLTTLLGLLRLPAVNRETLAKRVRLALITGSLADWSVSLQRATSEPEVKGIVTKIFREFRDIGLTP